MNWRLLLSDSVWFFFNFHDEINGRKYLKNMWTDIWKKMYTLKREKQDIDQISKKTELCMVVLINRVSLYMRRFCFGRSEKNQLFFEETADHVFVRRCIVIAMGLFLGNRFIQ